MDEKFIVAKAQTESELSNDEIVSGEPEMLLAMKEETKDTIAPSSMIDLYRQVLLPGNFGVRTHFIIFFLPVQPIGSCIQQAKRVQ